MAALIQVRPGSAPSVDELTGHCRTKVAGYKVPRFVRFVDRVERQPSGKPDYRWAASYAAEQASSAA